MSAADRDTRTEAVAREVPTTREWARVALAAADADDKANGIVRVKLDDAAIVERVGLALGSLFGWRSVDEAEGRRDDARRVLSVLREAVQP